jgi:hypothetical protein
VHTGLQWGNLRARDHLEGPDADGRIILKWIFRKWERGMSWIDLAKNRGGWRALVNAVMNLRVP